MGGDDVARLRRLHELVERVFGDKRFPEAVAGACDLRMFTLTAVWVVAGEACPEPDRWRRVCELLHLSEYGFWATVRQDVPRYEAPGWPRPSGRCIADEERARVQTGVPAPLPNVGGLLPCYLVADWREKYAAAMPGWEPPAAGICADDWEARSGAARPAVREAFKVYSNSDPGPIGPWPVPVLRVVRAKG